MAAAVQTSRYLDEREFPSLWNNNGEDYHEELLECKYNVIQRQKFVKGHTQEPLLSPECCI